jgi:hypothetical protein
MRRVAIALIFTSLLAGCIARAAGSRTDLDTFDESLANFQNHLKTCPYPAAHTMQFARSWDVPEFVIHAYVPKEIPYDKGKITD